MADEPKKQDAFPKEKTEGEKLVAPDYIVKERERMAQALRDAKPAFLNRPQDSPRPTIAQASPLLDHPIGSVVRQPPLPAFPPDKESEFVIPSIGSALPNISFLLQDATTTEGDPPEETNKVRVYDGKVNGQFPAGMGTGFDYVLDLADPSDSLIYVGVTFNPTTLLETSRFLGVSTAADYPEGRVESATEGFLYWLLGYTYFDADGAFVVWQSTLGNINFAFSYGSYNNKPALLPIDSENGWLDLEAIYPS